MLLARIDSLAPAHEADWEHVRGEILVAGVLARAGMADSARAVLGRARLKATPETDPERFFHTLEAHVRTILGDDEEAIELLTRFAAATPDAEVETVWWFRSLRDHPGFRDLVALTAAH